MTSFRWVLLRIPQAELLALVGLSLSLASCGGGDRTATNELLTAEDQAALALLFPQDAPTLTLADQLGLLRALGFRLEEDESALLDDACGQPVTHQIRGEDLNGDGTLEIIVDYGNACLSGMAGTSVMLFVRDASGTLRSNLGLPGLIAEVLPTQNLGYSDLLIGGPGFCFTVWRWNGEQYAHLRNEPQAPGGCNTLGAAP